MNEAEEKFKREAKKRGYKVLRKGYPDFVLIDQNNKNSIFFVEVKLDKDELSKEQVEMKNSLISCGFPVMVSRNGEWVAPVYNGLSEKILQCQKVDKLVREYHTKFLSESKVVLHWLKQLKAYSSSIEYAITQHLKKLSDNLSVIDQLNLLLEDMNSKGIVAEIIVEQKK